MSKLSGEGRATDRRSGPRRRGRWLEPLLFVLPGLLLLLAVYAVPIVNVVRYAFYDTDLLLGPRDWVGLDNFENLLDGAFLESAGRTAIWVVVTVSGAVAVGLGAALLLFRRMRFRWLWRMLVILPWVIPEALFAVMWLWVLDPRSGLLNGFLRLIGVTEDGINFLSLEMAFPTVMVIRIWRGAPFMMMAILAALQAIPKEMYEAARMDGASPFQTLRFVTIPLLKPVILASATVLAAWTLVIFDMIFVMTGGGPGSATEILSILMYEQGFQRFDLGLASAAALMTLVLVLVFGVKYVRDNLKAVR